MYNQGCNRLQPATLPPGEWQQCLSLGGPTSPRSATLWSPPRPLAVSWALATYWHSGCITQLPSPASQLSLVISFSYTSSVFPIIWQFHGYVQLHLLFPLSSSSLLSSSRLPQPLGHPRSRSTVCASAPSCCFCPASRKHDSFTCPAKTNSACPGQGDFSHLSIVSAYSQYLHNILSMWGNLKRFGSMPFG